MQTLDSQSYNSSTASDVLSTESPKSTNVASDTPEYIRFSSNNGVVTVYIDENNCIKLFEKIATLFGSIFNRCFYYNTITSNRNFGFEFKVSNIGVIYCILRLNVKKNTDIYFELIYNIADKTLNNLYYNRILIPIKSGDCSVCEIFNKKLHKFYETPWSYGMHILSNYVPSRTSLITKKEYIESCYRIKINNFTGLKFVNSDILVNGSNCSLVVYIPENCRKILNEHLLSTDKNDIAFMISGEYFNSFKFRRNNPRTKLDLLNKILKIGTSSIFCCWVGGSEVETFYIQGNTSISCKKFTEQMIKLGNLCDEFRTTTSVTEYVKSQKNTMVSVVSSNLQNSPNLQNVKIPQCNNWQRIESSEQQEKIISTTIVLHKSAQQSANATEDPKKANEKEPHQEIPLKKSKIEKTK